MKLTRIMATVEASKRIINVELIKMRHVMQQLRSQHSTHASRSNPTGVPSSPSYDMANDHAFHSPFHSTSPFHQTIFVTLERQPSHDIPTMQGMLIFILYEN